jgi:hypothetical protein
MNMLGVPKYTINNKQTHKSQNTLRVVAAQGREGPTAQKVIASRQAAGRGTPQANLRLARGPGTAPRNLRLARGLDAPSGESPPRSRDRDPRAPQAYGTTPAPPTGALNALVHHDARVKGESLPRRSSDTTWESYPDAVRPTRTVWPSPALRGCCAGRSVSFHDTVPPTPIPPPRHPLERERWQPRKRYGHLPRARLGQRRDVRPAECVSSITSGPVRPSLPLGCHPEHCSVIPSTVGTQVDGTSQRPLLCGLRSSVSRALESAYGCRPSKSSSATTLEAAPGWAQDPPRRPPEARFTRTTVNSTTLRVMLPHVALRPARHDCKPPPLGL